MIVGNNKVNEFRISNYCEYNDLIMKKHSFPKWKDRNTGKTRFDSRLSGSEMIVGI